MIFDKIHFTLNILSSDQIVNDKQNLIKLSIVDVIARTSIAEARFRIVASDGRNTPKEVLTWTELESEDVFYKANFTPTLTTTTGLQLQVEIKDIEENCYILSQNLKGVM